MRLAAIMAIYAALIIKPALADGAFNADMKFIADKADACRIEVNRANKRGRYCEEFDSARDYVFKGNMSIYTEIHIANGDIAGKSAEMFSAVMNKITSVMELERSTYH